jgi:hypothetical protein
MIHITASIGLPSRYSIGQYAYFQPNLALVDSASGKTDSAIAAKCIIIGVTFAASKIYYDVEVIYEEEYNGNTVQCLMPVYRIPSDMICDAQV